MTRLFQSQDPQLVNVDTDSLVVRNWIKASVSRSWLNKRWVYPLSELGDLFHFCETINEDVEVVQSVYDAYQTYLYKLAQLKEYKAGKAFDVSSSLFTGQLFDYQPSVVAQMLLMHKYLLALEVGLGKTVVSTAAFCKLREHKPVKVLIMCESNQVHKPWLETLYRFTKIKNILVVEGDASDRDKVLRYGISNREKHWIWICSYEVFRIEQDKFPKDWDVVIYDEITKVKNISAKTSVALTTIRADYVWGLSATPIKNTYLDLYGIMKVINPYLFTTKNNFINHYLTLDIFNRPIRIQKEKEPVLLAKMEPWHVQMVREDVLMTKPVHMKTDKVPLTACQLTKFEEIQQQIKEMDTTAFEQGTKLRQLCNTAKVFEEYKDLPLEETTNKLKVLEQILDETVTKGGKTVVVFSFFRTVIDELNTYFAGKYKVAVVDGQTKKHCPFAKQMDCSKCSKYSGCSVVKKHIYDFVHHNVQVLLGTDSLSRAHNLSTCDTIVNFDLPWTAADLKQRIGRIDRADNKAPELFVYNIVTEGTVEDKIIKAIEHKEKQSGKILLKYSVKISKLGTTVRTKKL